jgi:hypothetical protein
MPSQSLELKVDLPSFGLDLQTRPLRDPTQMQLRGATPFEPLGVGATRRTVPATQASVKPWRGTWVAHKNALPALVTLRFHKRATVPPAVDARLRQTRIQAHQFHHRAHLTTATLGTRRVPARRAQLGLDTRARAGTRWPSRPWELGRRRRLRNFEAMRAAPGPRPGSGVHALTGRFLEHPPQSF